MLTPLHTPRILIVEDEPTLGHLLIRALQWDGYDVVWVNGEAGFRAAKMWGKPYDLVITNSRSPGRDGVDPIGLINGLFPGLPILHLDDVSPPVGEPQSGATLYRPFGLDSLSGAVRELLAERTRAPA
jgi:DNA-binding response OmpR family regulator